MTDVPEQLEEILRASTDEDGDSIPESRRPALRRLSMDVEQLVDEMMAGFESRRHALEWMQRSIPRTLGEIPTDWIKEFAGQFNRGGEGTLLAALLQEDVRRREISQESVRETRTRIAIEIYQPAYHRAFRQLRTSATEYVDDSESRGTAAHDPNRQRYIAMRPALDEFDHYQEIALETLLDGLQSAEGIRHWGEVLELATHGELPEGFISRCVREPATRALLIETDPTPQQRRARELFAAYYLLPEFNRGIRDLRNKSKEEPDSERREKTTPQL